MQASCRSSISLRADKLLSETEAEKERGCGGRSSPRAVNTCEVGCSFKCLLPLAHTHGMWERKRRREGGRKEKRVHIQLIGELSRCHQRSVVGAGREKKQREGGKEGEGGRDNSRFSLCGIGRGSPWKGGRERRESENMREAKRVHSHCTGTARSHVRHHVCRLARDTTSVTCPGVGSGPAP